MAWYQRSIRHGTMSMGFGVAWTVTLIASYAYLFLGARTYADFSLLICTLIAGWFLFGLPACIFWLLAYRSGEASREGGYTAWIGLLLAMSGPAHLLLFLLA
ncbi:MAG TPA: hypothetical protein VFG68_11710 [Fimbriiglobus sp.]|nr:hypothetical protein [Fimbriiglobus sp.]